MGNNKDGARKRAEALLAKNPNYFKELNKLSREKRKLNGTPTGFAVLSPEQRAEMSKRGVEGRKHANA